MFIKLTHPYKADLLPWSEITISVLFNKCGWSIVDLILLIILLMLISLDSDSSPPIIIFCWLSSAIIFAIPILNHWYQNSIFY